jgi:sugar phosphate isomerase/epimerase
MFEAKAIFSGAHPTMTKPIIPIGLQLYSVRQQCAQDLPAVLREVSRMGYQGVEFAGYHGHTAEDLRKLLDENKLQCCGAHTGLDTLNEANFAATVAFHQIIGNRFLIVPGMPEERLETAAACKETAALFNHLAQKAKQHGMFVGYHAHNRDFKPIDGQTRWNLLFSNTSPDVVMQLDVGNCLDGGGDPYAILRQFPGRSRTIHLKEHGGPPGAPIGEGIVNWKEVFTLCESTGHTEWYIVEHENTTAPLQSVQACLENLKKMGKQ